MVYRWDWSDKPENLAAAVLAHRAAAHGHEIRLSEHGYAGPDSLAATAARLGLRGTTGEQAGAAGAAIRLPRIVLYAGAAIGYPYYAYYAHCLWSLGLSFRCASAAEVAGGLLDAAQLLIMPGGFATWGLDRAEAVPGVDRAVAGFIARGGACIGSCGGAFYLSEGRPGWLNAIDAKPRFSHEYLLTGTCLLNVRLTHAALRRDLPETLELPYYHGPVYDQAERQSANLGSFGEHVLANRLFIDNPIDAARYNEVMRGRVAILAGRSATHRVIGFSPHPEMGEFLRKGMVLDSYVRKYLPIRGAKIMQETLQFYAKEDCLGFRLVLNAAIMLGAFDAQLGASSTNPAPHGTAAATAPAPRAPQSFDPAWQEALARLRARLPADEDAGIAALIERELGRLAEEWSRLLNEDDIVARRAATVHGTDRLEFDQALQHTLADAMSALADATQDSQNTQPTPRRCPEIMVLLELPVRLLAAHRRISRCDRLLGESS